MMVGVYGSAAAGKPCSCPTSAPPQAATKRSSPATSHAGLTPGAPSHSRLTIRAASASRLPVAAPPRARANRPTTCAARSLCIDNVGQSQSCMISNWRMIWMKVSCDATVPCREGACPSGYCECKGGAKKHPVDCKAGSHGPFSCAAICAASDLASADPHDATVSTGVCEYNRPCAQQYVGKSQSCMVISGRLIVHAPVSRDDPGGRHNNNLDITVGKIRRGKSGTLLKFWRHDQGRLVAIMILLSC